MPALQVMTAALGAGPGIEVTRGLQQRMREPTAASSQSSVGIDTKLLDSRGLFQSDFFMFQGVCGSSSLATTRAFVRVRTTEVFVW